MVADAAHVDYCNPMSSSSLVFVQGPSRLPSNGSTQAVNQVPEAVLLNIMAHGADSQMSLLGSLDPSVMEQPRPADHSTAGLVSVSLAWAVDEWLFTEADGHPGCCIQPLEQLGSNLMELAAASKNDACVKAVARAIAEQKFGSYSVMLHLQDVVWVLQREPRHHRVLVALLSCVPLLQLEELGVGKEDFEEAQEDCVR